MRRQLGVSLSGFLLWAVVFIFVALLGFKLGPPYVEYMTIEGQLRAIANDPDARGGARAVVEDRFSRRAAIENINAISGKDIQIARDGDRVILSAEYSVCVPVVFNIRACMDYSASSGK